MQINNAILVLDLTTAGAESITSIWPLGWKAWASSAVDLSDSDGVALGLQPGFQAWYQPSQLRYVHMRGAAYLLAANQVRACMYACRV